MQIGTMVNASLWELFQIRTALPMINLLTESADNERLRRLLAGERDLGAAGR